MRPGQPAILLVYSRVAQLVEQPAVNRRVAGSSPASGAILSPPPTDGGGAVNRSPARQLAGLRLEGASVRGVLRTAADHSFGAGHAQVGREGRPGVSTPNCFAYSAFNRCQPPNYMASAPTMRPMGRFEHLGRVGPLHLGLVYMRRRRPHCRELCGANGTEVPVRIERAHSRRCSGSVSAFKPLQEGGGGRGRERASTSLHLCEPQRQQRHPARIAHGCSCRLFPFREGAFSILSKCCSRASTCFDQKRRKGTSHASSSMSGSGLSR